MQDFYVAAPLIKSPPRALSAHRCHSELRPLFLPFAGCPVRCVFCAQPLQTGTARVEIEAAFARLGQILQDARRQNTAAEAQPAAEALPFELAFYGGTFTLLPPGWQERFLDMANNARAEGLVSRVRCSTRPDAVDAASLNRLAKHGVSTVELGVQSFSDAALAASGRGYSGAEARAACERVLAHGFELVIQLLPGMPGQSPDAFAEDIAEVLALEPHALRLYPCLVIEGTELAARWRRGAYAPWSIAETCERLAPALLALSRAKIPVIRLGLAPEAELLPNILAGPWHPALGNLIQAEALYLWCKERLAALPGKLCALTLPKGLQGCLWGHAGELKPAYRRLGAGPEAVRFWDYPIVKFTTV